jgi:hypothetical protein
MDADSSADSSADNPVGDPADTTTPISSARAAVAAGGSPADAAATVVEAMTPDEKLWCLDGDAPTWVGLAFLGGGGYHEAPFCGAVVIGSVCPGSPSPTARAAW